MQHVYALSAQLHGTHPTRVLDQHNACYMIFQRLAEAERNPLKRQLVRLEAHKLARYEAGVCADFERVVWVTREDFAAVAVRRRSRCASRQLRGHPHLH